MANEQVVTAVLRPDGISLPAVPAETVRTQPNVIIRALTPARYVMTRALRVYLQSLLGLLAVAGMMPTAIGDQPGMATFWHAMAHAASLAMAPMMVNVLQNLVEVVNRVDQKAPTWTV